MTTADNANRKIFRKGSRTFSLAALIFDGATFRAACELYAWCRYCDDQVDSPQLRAGEDIVRDLREKTRLALSGQYSGEPAFEALADLATHFSLSSSAALDLVDGMKMDSIGQRFETLADLERYAYHVAGTVGLLMCPILGATSAEAQRAAKHLGIAMQLTNISRDVLEDAQNGRIYLPLEWLREEGIPPLATSLPFYREKLATLAARLVSEAEQHYRKGAEGFRYLKFRHAVAIAAASGMYRSIGFLVVARGAKAWDRRAVVSRWRKIWELVMAPVRATGFMRLA